MMRAICACGRLLGARNTSGRCRRCFWAAAPAAVERQRIVRLRATLAAAENRSALRVRLRAASRSRLSWCPLEYRDEYRRLTRVAKQSAATARTMIEAQIARDLARWQATGQLQATRA